MIELLNNPISTCSQKVRLCLHEKQLEFVNTTLDFRKKEHLSPSYLKLNPNGVVPTLLHDGRPVVDSSVIIEYLEDVFPENPLSPADPYDRARMRAWMRYIEEVPTTAIRVPSFNKAFVRHYSDLEDQALQANADDRPPPPENPMSADRVRWEHIQRVFELCDRNVSETARRLNMHRRTLQRILAKRSPR